MWVLAQQELGDLDAALDTALTYASGAKIYDLSAEERAAIHAVYHLYDQLLGQPDPNLTPSSLDGCRPVLYTAYDQVQIGGRLQSLRERLFASTDSCPYCGFGEVRELDHYLPRSVYGDLAIYPNNLIPSCGPCNNAKRTVVPGMAAANGPGLIHAYFQPLPDEDFLRADVSFAGGSLDVAFRVDPQGIEAALATKLDFQLRRLKLNARYPAQINKFLSEQRVAVLRFHGLGIDLLREYLRDCSTGLAKLNGRNDWRVVLLRALADHDGFCGSPELYFGEAA